jgi:hypothetical protein
MAMKTSIQEKLDDSAMVKPMRGGFMETWNRDRVGKTSKR